MMHVARTHDFDRIQALPRRKISLDLAAAWAEYLTPIFRLLLSKAALLPWQGLALAEAVLCQGAYLALPVGQGKTLVSWLLPLAMQSERALLVVPGSLVQKTHADFGQLAADWRRPVGVVRVVSRESLSVVSGATLLEQFAPDLIIADESDTISNPRAGATRRLGRYMRDHESCRCVAMTGTPARKSILSYWHWLVWALKDHAPVPLRRSEAQMWAKALDDHNGIRPEFSLLGSTLDSARSWYRQRLTETEGVLVVDEDSCTAALRVSVRLAPEDPVLDEAYAQFLIDDQVPGGDYVTDPLSRWRLDGQLGLGFFSRWNPPPPEAWCDARREAARFVRERVDATTRSSRPLDTEAQVFRAYPDVVAVRDWLAIKPTFAGVSETVWLTDSTLIACVDWLRERTADAPGIVWSGSVEFGERLARVAGTPYFGRKGQDSSGRSLHAAPQGVSFVASWGANKRGFNLQAWPRHLIVMPPQSAKWLEQIFGRSHRRGQDEPVHVEILATSGGTLDLIESAFGEAAKVRDTEGLTQKILRAEFVNAEPNVTETNVFRWTRKGSR